MARRRTNKEREADLLETAQRALRHERQEDIALALGVSQSQVSRDLGVLKKQWARSAQRDFARMRARELAELNHLVAITWMAWEASKLPKEIREISPREGRTSSPEICVETEHREGSPRYLRQVLAYYKKRRRLLKLNGPPLDGSLADSLAEEQILRDVLLLKDVKEVSLLAELDRRIGGIRVWLGLRAPSGVWTGIRRMYPLEGESAAPEE